MHPTINIFNLTIPSWHLFFTIGAAVSAAMAVYCRPKDFVLSRLDIAVLAGVLAVSGLAGARILFLILHGKLTVSGIVSAAGGFAYFGALLACIIILVLYSILRNVSFLALADYSIPFLMLSQVFVRMGCFMAGCCYGRPTNFFTGVTFKSVDGLARHPTQIYEAAILVVIYIMTRLVYDKIKKYEGMDFSLALFLYGSGRFYIEFLRIDSRPGFMGLTLAQLACFALILTAFFINRIALPRKD